MKCVDSQLYWNNNLPDIQIRIWSPNDQNLHIYPLNEQYDVFYKLMPLYLYADGNCIEIFTKTTYKSKPFSIPEQYAGKAVLYTLKDRRGKILVQKILYVDSK